MNPALIGVGTSAAVLAINVVNGLFTGIDMFRRSHNHDKSMARLETVGIISFPMILIGWIVSIVIYFAVTMPA